MKERQASQSELPSDPFSLSIYNISTQNHGIEVPVELNGIHLLKELDSGAGVSPNSEASYNKHFKGTFQPSNALWTPTQDT